MPKHIEFCLVLSCFSVFLSPEIKVLFLLEYICNHLAILTQCFLYSRAACDVFFKDSQLLSRIYSGFSGSLCGSMSNFDGLFLLEFLSNQILTLAQ